MVQPSEQPGGPLSPYIIVEGAPHRSIPIVSSIFSARGPVQGNKTDKPLIITFGGATGAGKTVLASLYATEMGIGYDPVELAKVANIKIDGDELKERFHLEGDQRVYVSAVPKFTTRQPRPMEVRGLDFYFVSPEDLQRLGDKVLFTYRYPPSEEGNLYGAPTSLLMPLKYGVDSITTMTGYEPFGMMLEKFQDAVGIWVDADPRDIEAHIKGRSASDVERENRLGSFPNDRQRFYENRQVIPYSVFMESLKSLMVDITPDTEGQMQILKELDIPFNQIKAIVKWERTLRMENKDVMGDPQKSFDYFLEYVVNKLFNGMTYEELQQRVEVEPVQIINKENDKELLESYSESRGVSRSLLEDIASRVQVLAVKDANGRRTIVLSPYSMDYLPSTGGSEKRAIIELLKQKLNGIGAYLTYETPGNYKPFSLLSLLNFDDGVDEGLFVYLTSDHIPPTELERPRDLNIVFSNTKNGAKPQIYVPSLEELVEMRRNVASDHTQGNIFLRSIPQKSH